MEVALDAWKEAALSSQGRMATVGGPYVGPKFAGCQNGFLNTKQALHSSSGWKTSHVLPFHPGAADSLAINFLVRDMPWTHMK